VNSPGDQRYCSGIGCTYSPDSPLISVMAEPNSNPREEGEVSPEKNEPDFSKKHPLETKWTLWFDNPNGKQKQVRLWSWKLSCWAPWSCHVLAE
jgi:hypothetical protein